MELLIISPEKELLNVKDIDLVECEGVEGKFQILKNHADMFSLLRQGEVIYEKDNIKKKIDLSVEDAVLRVKDNQVTIIL